MFKIIRLIAMVATLIACQASNAEEGTAWPSLQNPVGLSDPSLAFGLNGVADWSGVLPFVDVMKTVRPWIGGMNGNWGGMKEDELWASGCLDELGWPRCLPPGVDAIKGVFSWGVPEGPARADYRAGRYHLFYDGVGEIAVKKVSIVSQAPGHIVFDIKEYPGNWWLEIFSSGDASGSGHLRNIRIVREQNLSLLEAGVLFDPQWLTLIEDVRQVRFMDWTQINTSTVSDWHDAPELGTYSWMAGVPLSVQVTLANVIGADVWFNIPTQASDSYVAEVARYVRDYLDPRLVAYVEYGNEAWNFSFGNSRDLVNRGKRELDSAQVGEYYRKRASEIMQVWAQQFAPAENGRYVRILGGQTVNLWLSDILLEGGAWRSADRKNWKPANEVFDALAVTSYIGGKLWKEDDFRELLISGAANNDFEALNALMMDEDVEHSVPFIMDRLREQREIADDFGLKLVLYEGGQHIHQYIQGVSDDPEVLAALVAYVRSPEMAELYRLMWEQWQSFGDGPFMQFVEAGGVNKYGSWGMRLDPLDNPPRARLLDGLNAATPAWWVPKSEGQYQQGLTIRGDTGADRLGGTWEEDVLLGGAGDDVLRGGPGNDYLHGGEGSDTALFDGYCRDYSVMPVGSAQFLIRGLDGEDQIAAIEKLMFGDGQSISLGADFNGKALCSDTGG